MRGWGRLLGFEGGWNTDAEGAEVRRVSRENRNGDEGGIRAG